MPEQIKLLISLCTCAYMHELPSHILYRATISDVYVWVWRGEFKFKLYIKTPVFVYLGFTRFFTSQTHKRKHSMVTWKCRKFGNKSSNVFVRDMHGFGFRRNTQKCATRGVSRGVKGSTPRAGPIFGAHALQEVKKNGRERDRNGEKGKLSKLGLFDIIQHGKANHSRED